MLTRRQPTSSDASRTSRLNLVGHLGGPQSGISEVYWTMLVFFAPLKADDINNIMRDGLEKASTVSPRRKMTVKWEDLKTGRLSD